MLPYAACKGTLDPGHHKMTLVDAPEILFIAPETGPVLVAVRVVRVYGEQGGGREQGAVVALGVDTTDARRRVIAGNLAKPRPARCLEATSG